VLSFYFINKKIKSYTQIVNEEPINDELIDKEQTDEDII
jgi:hypothetical protein